MRQLTLVVAVALVAASVFPAAVRMPVTEAIVWFAAEAATAILFVLWLELERRARR